MGLWSVEKYTNGKWVVIANGLSRAHAEEIYRHEFVDISKGEYCRITRSVSLKSIDVVVDKFERVG